MGALGGIVAQVEVYRGKILFYERKASIVTNIATIVLVLLVIGVGLVGRGLDPFEELFEIV